MKEREGGKGGEREGGRVEREGGRVERKQERESWPAYFDIPPIETLDCFDFRRHLLSSYCIVFITDSMCLKTKLYLSNHYMYCSSLPPSNHNIKVYLQCMNSHKMPYTCVYLVLNRYMYCIIDTCTCTLYHRYMYMWERVFAK